jgi:Resolvase, N terminal domain
MAPQVWTVAYVRVSTDKQVEHGLSLEAQQAKLTAYAALYDLDLVAIEVDVGVSAKMLQRPARQQALGALKAGKAEALRVVKLDRLTCDGGSEQAWYAAAPCPPAQDPYDVTAWPGDQSLNNGMTFAANSSSESSTLRCSMPP